MPFIYEQRHRCPLSFYPPAWTGRPLFVFAGLHELSTPGVHSIDITADLVGSYPTFSPLPHIKQGGSFLLHQLTLADLFPLGSGMPCVARTFLSSSPPSCKDRQKQRQAGSLRCFCGQRYKENKNIEPIGYVFIRLFSIKATRVNQITGFPILKYEITNAQTDTQV